jgi:hypothetical protein
VYSLIHPRDTALASPVQSRPVQVLEIVRVLEIQVAGHPHHLRNAAICRVPVGQQAASVRLRRRAVDWRRRRAGRVRSAALLQEGSVFLLEGGVVLLEGGVLLLESGSVDSVAVGGAAISHQLICDQVFGRLFCVIGRLRLIRGAHVLVACRARQALNGGVAKAEFGRSTFCLAELLHVFFMWHRSAQMRPYLYSTAGTLEQPLFLRDVGGEDPDVYCVLCTVYWICVLDLCTSVQYRVPRRTTGRCDRAVRAGCACCSPMR